MYPLTIRTFWRVRKEIHGFQRTVPLTRPPHDVLGADLFEAGAPMAGWRRPKEGGRTLVNTRLDGEGVAREMLMMAMHFAAIADGGRLAISPFRNIDVRLGRPVMYWVHEPTGAAFLSFGLSDRDSEDRIVGGTGLVAAPLDFTRASTGYRMALASPADREPSAIAVRGAIERTLGEWKRINRGQIERITPDESGVSGERTRRPARAPRATPPLRKRSSTGDVRHSVRSFTREPRRQVSEVKGKAPPARPAAGDRLAEGWTAMQARAEGTKSKILQARPSQGFRHYTRTIGFQFMWAFREGYLDAAGSASKPPTRLTLEPWVRLRAREFAARTKDVRSTEAMEGLETLILDAMLSARKAGRSFAAGELDLAPTPSAQGETPAQSRSGAA